jgi:hypothetical protein
MPADRGVASDIVATGKNAQTFATICFPGGRFGR